MFTIVKSIVFHNLNENTQFANGFWRISMRELSIRDKVIKHSIKKEIDNI